MHVNIFALIVRRSTRKAIQASCVLSQFFFRPVAYQPLPTDYRPPHCPPTRHLADDALGCCFPHQESATQGLNSSLRHPGMVQVAVGTTPSKLSLTAAQPSFDQCAQLATMQCTVSNSIRSWAQVTDWPGRSGEHQSIHGWPCDPCKLPLPPHSLSALLASGTLARGDLRKCQYAVVSQLIGEGVETKS